MTKTLSLFMNLLICFGSVFLTEVEAQKKTSPSPIPVTSTIQDYDPVSFLPFSIQSDLLGSYLNGTYSVISQIQAAGDFELDMRTSTVRTVSIDLRDPVTSSVTSPPFARQLAPTRFITKCYQYTTYKTGLGGMKGVNSQISCPMSIGFQYGGQTYRLYMNPFVYGETNMPRITCTGVVGDPANANAPCNKWTIEPSATVSGQAKNIAKLLRVYTFRGKEVSEDRGDFYVTFSLGATNP